MQFTENKTLLSASVMLEYWYCPRFIYYMNILKLKQKEENRLKVQLGREIHEKKSLQPEYLRKKMGVVRQEKNIYLSSSIFGICGIIDELLFIDDNSLTFIDYKFAEQTDKYKTHFYQGVFYSLLVEENYKIPVDCFYLVYTRSSTEPVKYEIKTTDKENMLETIRVVHYITQSGFYPKATTYKARCADCTYANLCVK